MIIFCRYENCTFFVLLSYGVHVIEQNIITVLVHAVLSRIKNWDFKISFQKLVVLLVNLTFYAEDMVYEVGKN